ncbi:hypothetical protein LUZ60_017071 [Juncus effusus]|nr:hypothetical protein LUZ60_017071 [Juncus effusus]
MAGRPIVYRRRRRPDPPSTDRISSLPLEILYSILSHLTLKEAVRTSILSSGWRHLWCTNPSVNLSFPLEINPDFEIYSSIVESCLKSCSSIKTLQSMSFHIDYDLEERIYERWINFAKERSVRALSLLFYPCDEDSDVDPNEECEFLPYIDSMIQAPIKIFSISSLNFLHLKQCELPIPPLNCFPNLETLSLKSVVLNKKSLSRFIKTSPKLKHLKIKGIECQDKIVISSPSLETLEITKSYLTVICEIEIREVQNLRSLGLCCDLEKVDLSELDSTQLDEVKMFCNPEADFDDWSEWAGLVFAVSLARTLTVDYWLLEHQLSDDEDFGSRAPVFEYLKELQICGGPFANTWFPAIIDLLRECPFLEKLELLYNHDHDDAGTTELTHQSDDKCIPKNYNFKKDETIKEFKDSTEIAQNLKFVKFSGHHGYENLIKLIYFIATHADKLEKLEINTFFHDYEFDVLKRFKWASSFLKIEIVVESRCDFL